MAHSTSTPKIQTTTIAAIAHRQQFERETKKLLFFFVIWNKDMSKQ